MAASASAARPFLEVLSEWALLSKSSSSNAKLPGVLDGLGPKGGLAADPGPGGVVGGSGGALALPSSAKHATGSGSWPNKTRIQCFGVSAVGNSYI